MTMANIFKKTKVEGILCPMARVRQDLINERFGVPVGGGTYFDKKPVPYRWINDTEKFQVFLDGAWEDAESIDFEFENS